MQFPRFFWVQSPYMARIYMYSFGTWGRYGFNEYGGRAACNKFNAGGGCMMNTQQIIPQGQIVKVCSKANPDYALAIRDGRAVMLFYNPNDPTMVTFS